MHSASELLPRVYRKHVREAGDEEAILLALWPVVVGEKVAARTRPLRLFRDKLIVETVSGQWRKELAGIAYQIVDRLNDAAGKQIIKDVEFRLMAPPRARPPARATSAAAQADDEAVTIADPHLRRLYRLSRQRAQLDAKQK